MARSKTVPKKRKADNDDYSVNSNTIRERKRRNNLSESRRAFENRKKADYTFVSRAVSRVKDTDEYKGASPPRQTELEQRTRDAAVQKL